MTKTYCEITQDGELKSYAIHLSEQELGLISDLLNSTNDLRAVRLRTAVESMIRAQDSFKLAISTKIKKCKYCLGSGSKKLYDEFQQKTETHTCQKCLGEGRMVITKSIRYEPLTPFWKNHLAKEY